MISYNRLYLICSSLYVRIIACILFEIIRVCFDEISLSLSFFFSSTQKSKISYLRTSAFLPFQLRLIKNIFNNTTTAKTSVHAKNTCFHVFFFAKHKRRHMSLAQLGEPIREVMLGENGGKDFVSWLILRLHVSFASNK